ncbi:MAG: DHH family phosphoesterase [Sphaerochaetaceae bacterium]|jgi:phosphoesterase RecJ-like protein
MFVYPDVPPKVLEALKAATVAVIIGHVGPDGDCIHSQIAMQKLLQRLGCEAHLVNAGPFQRKEIRSYEKRFSAHISQELYDRNPLVVMVDCSTIDRIGYLSEEIEGLTILTIDHHASGKPFGDLSYIVPKSFSTTLVIMQIFKALDIEITTDVAEHLLFGLATDTGFFKFIGPYRGETFALVGELVDKGVSPNEIFSQMEGGNSLASSLFLGKLLQSIEVHLDGRLLVVVEDPQDLERFGESERPTDALYAHLLGIDGVQAALYIKFIDEGVWEVGFRGSHYSAIDVGSISVEYGGGGHKKAAGATVESSLEELKTRLIASIEAGL